MLGSASSQVRANIAGRFRLEWRMNSEEIDDHSYFLSGTPYPVVSFLVKDFLSNSNINNFNQKNNAHYSTFCLLNKASIINSIRQRTANRSVPEGILDSLQTIEQLDRQQGLPISDSMREAFCAVAVHCTLTSLPLSWPCYFDAVQRIWRFRIRNLEDSGTSKLVGLSLRIWRDDLEAALWDAETCKRLLRVNTQDEALLRISVYMEEARSSMKPAFLALASSSSPTVNLQSPPRCSTDKEILGVHPQRRCKIRSSHRHSKRSVVIAALEGDQSSCSKYGFLSTPEVNKLQDEVNPSTLPAGVTDPLPQALKEAERVASDMARKNLHTETIVEDCNKDKGVPATSVNPTIDVLATFVNHTTDSTQAKRIAPDMAGKNLHAKPDEEGNSKMDNSVPSLSVNPRREPAQAKDDTQGKQAFLHQNRVLRPSLMERNGTARTYELEDSIDVSAEGTASSLRHVSPLKEPVTQKWLRKRKISRWSLQEEEALMKGVKEYGPKWKHILKSNPEAFIGRIPGDLKDKWRNLRGK